jgi:hypothetical protein
MVRAATVTARACDAAEAEKEVQCPCRCERWTGLHKATAQPPGKHGQAKGASADRRSSPGGASCRNHSEGGLDARWPRAGLHSTRVAVSTGTPTDSRTAHEASGRVCQSLPPELEPLTLAK